MNRFPIMACLLFASTVFAQVEIPHVHENGDVIDADEINQNLDVVAKAVPPRDCSTDQIIKWNGSAWVCASRLTGAITMIDYWYPVGGTSHPTYNMGFTQISETSTGGAFGLMRGEGNQMAFMAGNEVTGSGHGFSFPETGIYKVELAVYVDIVGTVGDTYVQAQYSANLGEGWDFLGDLIVRDSSASRNFSVKITDPNTQRLRFNYFASGVSSSVSGSAYTHLIFTRIEP
jgi:hypothetical protein